MMALPVSETPSTSSANCFRANYKKQKINQSI